MGKMNFFHDIKNACRRSLLLAAIVLSTAGMANAQSKETMTDYQNQLQQLFDRVANAPTDNERYNANELAVQLFEEALKQENSFFWKWQFGNQVSVLTSSDKQFRIITWAVIRDNGEWECFGFVQSYNSKNEDYDVYVLNDMSDEIISREEVVLGPENWLGSVYQELIETKHEGRMYYTLLGWTGCNNLTQRKVIEPICFRASSSKPQFGQPLFRREKNLRRVVLEYARGAMVNVRFDEQTVRTFENKKVKKKGRVYNVQVQHEEKMKMILFDEVAPMLPGMEGLYSQYVPTGTELAYLFVNGRWELRDNAEGRLADPKLNKEFEPLPKNAPAYKVEK